MANCDIKGVALGEPGPLELGDEQIGAALDTDAALLVKVRRRNLVQRVLAS